jgi:hypothetical protein
MTCEFFSTESDSKSRSVESTDDNGSDGNNENDEIYGEEENENSDEEDYSDSESGDSCSLEGTSGEKDYDSDDYNIEGESDHNAESNSPSDEEDNESVDDVENLAASSSDSDSSGILPIRSPRGRANQALDNDVEIMERVSPEPGM